MADNVILPLTGSGDSTATVATDDAGAAGQVQIVKLAISTDGSATAIPADATNGILVNLGSNNEVTVSGSVAVTGTFFQATQPISHAALTELAAAIDTEVQVDVVGALPAGTNAIGKLAANSGVDIGDVDVTSIAAGSNIIGRVGHDITGIGHGVKTVSTAGTDEALAGSTACKRVTIQAQTDNTSAIAVGATGVDATVATGNGVLLYAGDVFELEIDNLADVYIDSLVNGEGVRYTYFT